MIAFAIHAAGVHVVTNAIHVGQIVDQIMDLEAVIKVVDKIMDLAVIKVVDRATIKAVARATDLAMDLAALLVVQAVDQFKVDATHAHLNVIHAAQHSVVSLVPRFIHLAAHQLSANHVHLNALDLNVRQDAPQVSADKVFMARR